MPRAARFGGRVRDDGVLASVPQQQRDEIEIQIFVAMEDLQAAMDNMYFEHLDLCHTMDYILWGKTTFLPPFLSKLNSCAGGLWFQIFRWVVESPGSKNRRVLLRSIDSSVYL